MVAMPSSRSDVPEPGLEPGDRFEVLAADPAGRLAPPRGPRAGGFAIERLEDDAGRPLEMAIDPTGRRLDRRAPGRWLPDPFAALWLEYQAPGRFRLVVEPGPAGPAEGELDHRARGPHRARPGGPGGGPGGAGAGGRPEGVRPGAAGRPAGDARRVRPADRAADGARHGAAGAPDPHGQDRAAAVPRPGPAVRRGGPGQDDRGRADPLRAGRARPGPLGPGPRAPLADRAVAGGDAPQVRAGADQPRRPGLPRAGRRRLGRVRSRDRVDPHGQARAAPLGDPGPRVGHGDRRRGPPPAQPQHAGVEVRQRAAQAVHPAADGHAGAEQPGGAVQPGHAAGAGAAEHGEAVPAAVRRPARQADAAARRRAARAAGGGDGPQPPEHGGPAVHPPLGPHRAADALRRPSRSSTAT